MPELFDVANHFDDVQVFDAYTSAFLFKAQTSSFLGASPDGSVANKRVLSMAPNLVLPPRRVVTALTETYVLGTGILDAFDGRAIRRSVWTRLVTDNFALLTPGAAALAGPGTAVFGHKSYLKDTVNVITDAGYYPFWEVFFASGEAVAQGSFFRTAGAFYRARSVHADEAGFLVAMADEVPTSARVSVAFTQQGAYDPVAETYAAGTVNTFGILLDRHKQYDLLTEADPLNKAGDMSLTVAASAVTPVVGRTVTIASRAWEVLTVTPELDAYTLHIRRA